MSFYERVYSLSSYMENYNNENGLQRTVAQDCFLQHISMKISLVDSEAEGKWIFGDDG